MTTIERSVRPATRMYFYVEPHHFIQFRNKWKKMGIDVSDITGTSHHVYDPDGNRINVTNGNVVELGQTLAGCSFCTSIDTIEKFGPPQPIR